MARKNRKRHFDQRVHNIAAAIEMARNNPRLADLLPVFEATAMRWIYRPMVGANELSAEEIAAILEAQL